jgi:hypothetical protein
MGTVLIIFIIEEGAAGFAIDFAFDTDNKLINRFINIHDNVIIIDKSGGELDGNLVQLFIFVVMEE